MFCLSGGGLVKHKIYTLWDYVQWAHEGFHSLPKYQEKTKDASLQESRCVAFLPHHLLYSKCKQVSGEPGKQKRRGRSPKHRAGKHSVKRQRKWLLIKLTCSFEWMVTNREASYWPASRRGKSNTCWNEVQPPSIPRPDPEDLGWCLTRQSSGFPGAAGDGQPPVSEPQWLLQPAGPSTAAPSFALGLSYTLCLIYRAFPESVKPGSP